MSVVELKQAIDRLSPEERLELAEYIRWQTKKDDPEWQREIGRRLDECLSGKSHSAEELEALHEKLTREGSSHTGQPYHYIVRKPGICSGCAIIEGTRIGVHDVVGLLHNGERVDTISRCFPEISKAQVYECLAYYEDHRDEIDHLVAGQMADSLLGEISPRS